jgi:hypothetical protein
MSEKMLLEKINKNSGAIEAIIKTAVVCCAVIGAIAVFLNDVKGLPPRVDRLESRVASLEMNYATYVARIDTALNKLNNDLDMIKLQIIRQGMAHDEKVTRVIHEYPHEEKEPELEYGKDK